MQQAIAEQAFSAQRAAKTRVRTYVERPRGRAAVSRRHLPGPSEMGGAAADAAATAHTAAPGAEATMDGLLPAMPAGFRPSLDGRERGSTVSPRKRAKKNRVSVQRAQ